MIRHRESGSVAADAVIAPIQLEIQPGEAKWLTRMGRRRALRTATFRGRTCWQSGTVRRQEQGPEGSLQVASGVARGGSAKATAKSNAKAAKPGKTSAFDDALGSTTRQGARRQAEKPAQGKLRRGTEAGSRAAARRRQGDRRRKCRSGGRPFAGQTFRRPDRRTLSSVAAGHRTKGSPISRGLAYSDCLSEGARRSRCYWYADSALLESV